MCDTLNVMGTEKSGLTAPLLGDISGSKPCITSDKKNRSDDL